MTNSVISKKFCIIIGIASIASFALFLFFDSHHNPLSQTDECINYPFVDTTIDCTTINDELSRTNILDTTITHIIDEERKVGNIITASVFYRDLTTRRWFGINETENFYAASLLKLPLAMMYFKIAEIDPKILDQTVSLPITDIESNQVQFFKPTKVFEYEQDYTIQELIEGMLRYSDNAPLAALNEFIQLDIRTEILRDLGIEFIDNDPNQPQQHIDVKKYSNILRQLYNASYLTLEYSNLLLEYLSNTTFSQGIKAGVPEDILVSHKFGEAHVATLNPKNVHVLHDCGIVYRPHKPYILCIMTKGHDPHQSTHSIKRISEAVYNF